MVSNRVEIASYEMLQGLWGSRRRDSHEDYVPVDSVRHAIDVVARLGVGNLVAKQRALRGGDPFSRDFVSLLGPAAAEIFRRGGLPEGTIAPLNSLLDSHEPAENIEANVWLALEPAIHYRDPAKSQNLQPNFSDRTDLQAHYGRMFYDLALRMRGNNARPVPMAGLSTWPRDPWNEQESRLY